MKTDNSNDWTCKTCGEQKFRSHKGNLVCSRCPDPEIADPEMTISPTSKTRRGIASDSENDYETGYIIARLCIFLTWISVPLFALYLVSIDGDATLKLIYFFLCFFIAMSAVGLYQLYLAIYDTGRNSKQIIRLLQEILDK